MWVRLRSLAAKCLACFWALGSVLTELAQASHGYPLSQASSSGGGGGAGADSSGAYKETSRYYNIQCWACFSEDEDGACAKGNTNNEQEFLTEKCTDQDSNLCYVQKYMFRTPQGEMKQYIRRGCAHTPGNPCNSGPKTEACEYQVCKHHLCNSSPLLASNIWISISLFSLAHFFIRSIFKTS